jgi:hypothetical protein
LPLPSLSPPSLCLVVTMTLVEATGLLASCSEATRFTVLMDGVDDPVDTWITANGTMLRVNEDDFEVLVGAVLIDPV